MIMRGIQCGSLDSAIMHSLLKPTGNLLCKLNDDRCYVDRPDDNAQIKSSKSVLAETAFLKESHDISISRNAPDQSPGDHRDREHSIGLVESGETNSERNLLSEKRIQDMIDRSMMALESRLMKQMKEMLANALERNTLSFDR